MLERDRELDVLLAAHERAEQGRGAAVLVSGEAGIGKTTLLRAYGNLVAGRSDLWVGECDDLVTPRPLGPFREMFAAAGPYVDVDGDVGRAPHADRDAMIDEVLRRVRAAPHAVSIVIDDAHWADDASLDVARYVARRVGELPCVLCLAYRAAELGKDHPLRRLVGALTGPSVVRLALRPLGRASVEELAADTRLDAGELMTLTGGNPFLLAETLRSPDDDVPRPVRDAILARVAALAPEARSAVELVSQMPEGADWATVSVLVSGAAGALRDAEAAGLIGLERDAFRFRHELGRRVVDESLAEGHRLALNRRLLDYHEVVGADRHALVHHAALARDWDAIARHAPGVVEESAAAGAHYDTEQLALLALERRELLDERTVATLLLRAAQAAYTLNRFGDARTRAVEAARALEPLGDAVALGEALEVVARMHLVAGESRRARRAALRAVELIDPTGACPGLARSYGTMAYLDCLAGDDVGAVRWGRMAIALAEQVGDREAAAHAGIYLGISRVRLDDEAGFDDVRAAIDVARRLGHAEYVSRGSANLATLLIGHGRFDEAREPLADAIETARDHDIEVASYYARALRCQLHLLVGDWDRAESELTDLLAGDDDPAAMLVLPLSLLGRLRTRRGDPGAGELVRRAWSIAVQSRQTARIAHAGLALVEHAWHTRPPDELADTCREVLRTLTGASAPYFEGELRRYLRRAGVEVGSFDRCPPALDAGIRGDWSAAARLWQTVGADYHRALELVESAERETALAGLAQLDDLGATGTAARVRQVLRARGWSGLPRGPRPDTRHHPAGLTPRQHDVLVELVDGKTSAEIGETLYVSSRTVDNHVAAIVRKLGADDRRDAVRIALEQDLVGGAHDA